METIEGLMRCVVVALRGGQISIPKLGLATLAVLFLVTPSGALDRSPDYDVLVTSYPWSHTDPVRNFTTRCPEWSQYNCASFKGQNTPAYGRYVVDLAEAYGIDYLSGFWHHVNDGTLDNFKASFPPSVNLKGLRLVYMAGLLGFDDEDPTIRTTIEETIKSWRTDVSNTSRYGYVKDSNGTSRPIIMLWGNQANGHAAEFKAMIESIRLHYDQVDLQPYFIMTQHGLQSNSIDIITAVDGFYLHSGGIPPVGSTTNTWAASKTVNSNINGFRNQVYNKFAEATGVPLGFLAGGMVHFDRTLREMNYDDHIVHHGVIKLNCRLQATEFYKMLRTWASVPGLQRPIVTLTSLNEWPENSTIEPTLAMGVPYPAGNYEYDLVEGLRQVFGMPTLTVDFGTNDVTNGLSRPAPEPSDGQTTAVTVAVKLVQGSNTYTNVNLRKIEGTLTNARYIYVRVDDNELFDGSEETTKVEITYADLVGWQGQSFKLQYDSTSGAYTNIGNVQLVGDDRMKTFTFDLTGVKFANRENGGSDLRIVVPPSTRLHVYMVKLIKSTTTRRTTNPCL